MSYNLTSFWEFLKENYIEIPIIQRDYAQGREGRESLRKTFLGSIFKALRHEAPYTESNPLELDFVYGSLANGKLQPLDGQQRLTTLWLLHWYIALRAGKLAEASVVLKRFSYETRMSSREFCAEMCIADNFKDYEPNIPIRDYITSRTWFSDSWEDDPTIRAMLRMLEGFRSKEKSKDRRKNLAIETKNKELDGIEKYFRAIEDKCGQLNYFEDFWQPLTSDTAPIVFYYLSLHDFGLSDDLYIKMNARGKQLTFFENFKADLIRYIRKEAEKENLQDGKWSDLLNIRTGLPIKLDTDWSEIFWDNRCLPTEDYRPLYQNGTAISKDSIDEIFYVFLNRLFWNELFSTNTNLNDDESVQSNTSYASLNELYDKRPYPLPPYEGFAPYLFDNESIPLSLFETMMAVLDSYLQIADVDSLLTNPYSDKERVFNFIPKYKDGIPAITTISQAERLLFFGVCKYLVDCNGEVDMLKIKQWMRIVYNMASGDVSRVSDLRKAIDLLAKIDSTNPYQSLANIEHLEKDGSELDKRYQEEIEKAQKIVSDSAWEAKIIEAERYGKFNGGIRFLYRNADGNPAWEDFDNKFNRAQQLFEHFKTNETDASYLKTFIAQFSQEDWFDGFEYINYRHRIFNNKSDSWLYLLMNTDLKHHVHNFIIGTPVKAERREELKNEWWQHALWLLTETELLDFVMKEIPASWIRGYKSHYAIFPSAPGVFLNAKERDEFLADPSISLHPDEKRVPNCNLIMGNDIKFNYQNYNFVWEHTNNIYLADDNWEYGSQNSPFIKASEKDIPQIKSELDNLIKVLVERGAGGEEDVGGGDDFAM